MQGLKTLAVCNAPKPRSFVGLMDLYEANYISLRCLCPDLQKMCGYTVSHVPGHMDLHLRVIEHSRYTTTILLSYLFRQRDGLCVRPNLPVRLYYDARQAEVLSFPGQQSRELDFSDTSLPGKWLNNRFLYRWLRYCLLQQHRFKLAAID